ncbi:hypothetical protein DL95DRAFT_470862 [Leptodontidium sp. 2 PMI_412]|nr:hypothetical protein DL95DRAFT_470862 [Leptodontidium sp. 2 PMI_412]
MNSNDSLPSLLSRVVAAANTIDKFVMDSTFIRMTIYGYGDDGPDLVPFTTEPPEYYLEKEDSLNFWDRYFNHLITEWDAGRLSYMKMNVIVERLSSPAAELDLCAPELVRIYRNLPNVPEERIQGVLRRHSAINAFLNSADIGIELWKHNDSFPVEGGIRRRRPQPHPTGQETKSTRDTNETLLVEAPIPNGILPKILHRILLIPNACLKS